VAYLNATEAPCTPTSSPHSGHLARRKTVCRFKDYGSRGADVATIAALIVDVRERERIARMLRAIGNIRYCERPVGLWQLIAAGDVGAVILDLRDADDRPTVPTVLELRRVLPSLPVAVHATVDPVLANRGLAAVAATPGVFVVDWREDESFPATVRDTFAAAPPQNATTALLQTLDAVYPQLDNLVASYLRTILLHARWPLRVHTAMELIDPTKRRTLDARLERANLPTAEQLIGWSLALHASWFMGLPGATVGSVATRLGFNDPSSLRSLFRAHIGMTAAAVIREGGFPYLAERWTRLMHGDWSHERKGRTRRPLVNHASQRSE
jgi:AraC-like DNA-binding protein